MLHVRIADLTASRGQYDQRGAWQPERGGTTGFYDARGEWKSMEVRQTHIRKVEVHQTHIRKVEVRISHIRKVEVRTHKNPQVTHK